MLPAASGQVESEEKILKDGQDGQEESLAEISKKMNKLMVQSAMTHEKFLEWMEDFKSVLSTLCQQNFKRTNYKNYTNDMFPKDLQHFAVFPLQYMNAEERKEADKVANRAFRNLSFGLQLKKHRIKYHTHNVQENLEFWKKVTLSTLPRKRVPFYMDVWATLTKSCREVVIGRTTELKKQIEIRRKAEYDKHLRNVIHVIEALEGSGR